MDLIVSRCFMYEKHFSSPLKREHPPTPVEVQGVLMLEGAAAVGTV